MKIVLHVLLGTLLSFSAAFAVTLETKPVVDGTYLVGTFPNGARFVFRTRSNQPNQLSYQKDGPKTSLNAEGLKFWPEINYDADEKTYYFLRADKLPVMLTESGVLQPVLLNSERFDLDKVVISHENSGYIIVSSVYRASEVVHEGHSGETHLIRLSDGARFFMSRDYVAEPSKLFADQHFDVAKVISESSLREKAHPYIESHAPISRHEERDDDTRNLERSWSFENGTKLVLRRSEGKTTAFVETLKGKGEVITTGDWVSFSDAPQIDAKLVMLQSRDGFWVVTEDGKATKLNVNLRAAGHVGEMPVVSTLVIQHAGRQYELVSFSRGTLPGHEAGGETFIVREDGVAFRVDYKSYDFNDGNEVYQIYDDILQLRSGVRSVDLRAFEAEARFDARPPQGDPQKALEAVEELLHDMAADVRAGKPTFKALDQSVIDEVRLGLGHEESRSVVITGESGSGKTKTAEALVAGMASGEYPDIPRTWRIFKFDPVSVNQGAQLVGTLEERIKAVQEAARAIPMYLVVDEMHSLRGIGTHSGNNNDVFQYLKTGMADGDIMMIGTATDAEFDEMFSGDKALLRRFTRVKQPEPKSEKVNDVLRGWAQRYKKVAPNDALLSLMVRVSNEFDAIGVQPAKATKLMDQVYAQMKLQGRFNQAPTKDDIEAAAQKLYHADFALFDLEAMNAKLANLAKEVDLNIIGQDHVKNDLIKLIRQAYAGTHDPTKPRVRFLNAGPRGSGKTALAYVVANALGLPIRRFEMNTYGPGDAPKILGEIAQALRANAFTVLLFDEIEKSPTDVQQALLGLLDSGTFSVQDKINTASSGGKNTSLVSARNAIVIATTNAGVSQRDLVQGHGKMPLGFGSGVASGSDIKQTRRPPSSDEVRQMVVADGMPIPLVDRFQKAGWSEAATAEEFRGVLKRHIQIALAEMEKRLEVKLKLTQEDVFLDALMESFKAGMSNRKALELIQDSVRSAMANARLGGFLTKGESYNLIYADGVVRLASCQEPLLR